MADSAEAVELVLEDDAKEAVLKIVSLLTNGGTPPSEEEAVQRALGTELYLLNQVRHEDAKVFVVTKKGRFELDLLGR